MLLIYVIADNLDVSHIYIPTLDGLFDNSAAAPISATHHVVADLKNIGLGANMKYQIYWLLWLKFCV